MVSAVRPSDQAASVDGEALAPHVLAIVCSVADELRPQARSAAKLGMDHSLERDFGLDSLARVELITRIGHDLGVALGEGALTEAETPRDLLRFITASAGAPATPAVESARDATDGRSLAPMAALDLPDSVETLVEVFDWHLQHQPHLSLIHI